MSRFYVVNESSEDTLGSAENLSDAIEGCLAVDLESVELSQHDRIIEIAV